MRRSTPSTFWDSRRAGLVALLLMCVTLLACCLALAIVRPFWVDELLEFYADVRPGLGTVLHDQIYAPLSLDAPGLHVLLHGTLKLIPSHQLGARLPSAAALLLLGTMAYFTTLRITGKWVSGIVAMLLSAFLLSIEYGAEGRCYALLAAAAAVAVYAYTHLVTGPSHRTVFLWTLGIGVYGAAVMHFYGVFLVLPLLAGEAFRTWQLRRVDRAVLTSIVVAAALGALSDYPFTRALPLFRAHYYNSGQRSFAVVPFTYAWMTAHLLSYEAASIDRLIWSYTALAVALTLVAASVVRLRRQWRKGEAGASIEIVLSALALMPFLDFVLAQATRANEPRYSVTGIVGLAVLGALLCRDFFRLERVQLAIAAYLLFTILVDAFYFTRYYRRERATLDTAHLSAGEAATLASLPDQHIYVQDIARYLVEHTYAPESLRERLVGFHSLPCELRWTGRSVSSLFAQNFQTTTPVPFVSYKTLLQDPSPHLVLIFNDPLEEWIGPELQAQKAPMRRLGELLGGVLYEVTLPQALACAGKD